MTCLLPTAYFTLSTLHIVNYCPFVNLNPYTTCLLLTANYLLHPIHSTHCQSPFCQPQSLNDLPTAYCQLPTSPPLLYTLPIALLSTSIPIRLAYCLLPTSPYPLYTLPIALLSTSIPKRLAYCLLPTAYFTLSTLHIVNRPFVNCQFQSLHKLPTFYPTPFLYHSHLSTSSPVLLYLSSSSDNGIFANA
jgi:hypothetical protein